MKLDGSVMLASLVSLPLIPELMHTSFCSLKRAVGVIFGFEIGVGFERKQTFLQLMLPKLSSHQNNIDG